MINPVISIENYYVYTMYGAFTTLITTILIMGFINFDNNLSKSICLAGLFLVLIGIIHLFFVIVVCTQNLINKQTVFMIGLCYIFVACILLGGSIIIELWFMNEYVCIICIIMSIIIIMNYVVKITI